jgi:gamma-glutamyltranspeptidase/glutathione hydrolase
VQPSKLSLGDLRDYRAVFRPPVRFTYRGQEIVSAPPPSSGGITLGLMLGMLEPSDMTKIAAGSLEEIEMLARVGNTAFADRNAYLGDQDWTPAYDMRALLDRKYVAGRREAALHASPRETQKPGMPFSHPPGDAVTNPREGQNTTHFSIIDADRNVVACTTTIEHGMGCGLVVPGRGFLLNNELTDFDLDLTKAPNAVDASRRQRHTALSSNPLPMGEGRVSEPGGKRPRSSMTPVIVFKDGKPYLSTGSPGGSQIIGIVAQVLVNALDHGMDMQQAINAPRMNSRNGPITLEALYLQRGELATALRQRGWPVKDVPPGYEVWGGAQGSACGFGTRSVTTKCSPHAPRAASARGAC